MRPAEKLEWGERPTVDLAALKALAQTATPGPWEWWTSNSTLRLTGADGKDGGVLHGTAHRGHGDISCEAADQAFIAAANPTAILSLLARVEQAESELAAARQVGTHLFNAVAAQPVPAAVDGGLTEERIEEIWSGTPAEGTLQDIRHNFARAIEREVLATAPALLRKKFFDLPLGTRFRYIGGTDEWVILERHGRGKVAGYQPHDGWVAGQSICSFADSEEECRALEVDVVLDAPSTAAQAEQPAAAWMTEGGERVVSASTMEGARRDGGAMLSSMRPYTVKLVREQVTAAQASVRDAAPEGFDATISAGEYDIETGLMYITVKLPGDGLPVELRTIGAPAAIRALKTQPANQ